MRALVAALLAVALLTAAAAPHVHAHRAPGEDCTACVLRHTAPPRSEVPEVAPIVHVAGDAASAVGLPPVFGAPLGAIPGQSPPAGA